MDRINEIKTAIQFSNEKLAVLPDEKLIIRIRKGQAVYYSKDKSGHETYINQKDLEYLRKMQEKMYFETFKKVAEEELVYLTSLQKLKPSVRFEEVFFNLPLNQRTLIKPYTLCFSEQVGTVQKKWKESIYFRKPVSPDLNFITMNGEKVRSKSELIIADHLKAADVPYCYESRFIFKNDNGEIEIWFPDFQVINKRTGEVFYWEHFGLMDNADYCNNTLSKLETYAMHGILPGKNLIFTMECSLRALNVSYVDLLIKHYLK